jgi:hypothetical protein
MIEQIRILTLERDSHDGVIVTFSDGTTAGYVVEELLDLRPQREPIRRPRMARGIFKDDSSVFSSPQQ